MLITFSQNLLHVANVRVKSLVFIKKNGNFCNYFKKHLIKNSKQNASINCSIFKIFSEELVPKHLCHSMQCRDIHIIHFWKIYLHAFVKSCNVCAIIAF